MSVSATLAPASSQFVADERSHAEGYSLDRAQDLDRFLRSVEKRAFRIARIALRDHDDALDIVQDAMLQLARRYSDRPSEEWKPLFYRILQNRIRDCRRRRMVRAKFLGWLPGYAREDGSEEDPIAAVPDGGPLPPEELMSREAIERLETALGDLPPRQQEAFVLRNFEGLDVAETAAAMGCSAGSVKTHYSRAVHTLRAQLGESW